MPRAIIDIDRKVLDDVDVPTTYWRLLGYVRPFLAYLSISIFGFLLFALSQPAFAMLLEVLLRAIDGEYVDGILFIPAACVGIALVRGIGSYLGNYYMGKLGAGVVHSIRCDLFSNLVYLPMQFFDNNKTSNLISLFTYNATALTQSVTRAFTTVVRDGLTVVALLGYMVYVNWKLTMVFLLIGPLIGLVIGWVGKRVKKLGKGIQTSMADINHVAGEIFTSLRLVKGSVQEEQAIDRFADASQNTRRLLQKMTKTTAIYTPMMQMLVIIAMAVVMYIVLLFGDDMDGATVMAYIAAAAMLPKPVRSLSDVYAQILQGVVAAHEIFAYIDRDKDQRGGDADAGSIRGALQFDGVGFSYGKNEEPVLRDISFSVKPLQTVALVGKSGSGKSTLASLLQRFYDADAGEILVDAVPLDQYSVASLRRAISSVSQQVTLFNTSVRENIGYGSEGASEEQIIAAAKIANAHDFISELPQGYDTPVGENGGLLSGGQRQRVAIARAVLRDAPVLILDEATSALDNESEALIQSALESLMTQRTTLVIAHRLSTVERADEILVLDEGRIVERGNHRSLIEQNGYYARMVAGEFSA